MSYNNKNIEAQFDLSQDVENAIESLKMTATSDHKEMAIKLVGKITPHGVDIDSLAYDGARPVPAMHDWVISREIVVPKKKNKEYV